MFDDAGGKSLGGEKFPEHGTARGCDARANDEYAVLTCCKFPQGVFVGKHRFDMLIAIQFQECAHILNRVGMTSQYQ